MILGVNWMRMVSPVLFDFQASSISMKWKGERVELTDQYRNGSNKILTCQTISGLQKEESYFLCHVVAIEDEDKEGDGIPDGVRGLLHQYQDLFEEPKGLPPTRTHDHLIPLKEGSSPVSSNPYRCPYVHKK